MTEPLPPGARARPDIPHPLIPAGAPRPAFVVGVTGHMNLPRDEATLKRLREEVEKVFDWLRDRRHPGCKKLGKPLQLEAAPILLLTSLAPGADQMVAEVALSKRCQVRCPLPFPHERYREASTFVHALKEGAGEHEVAEVIEANRLRQEAFDRLVGEIGPDHTFLVEMAQDVGLSKEELDAKLAADLGDRERRNRRYRAAGEYVSAYCDILIAICDLAGPDDPLPVDAGLPALAQPGAGHIVRSHLNGLEPGILPVDSALSWADNGPVIRIYCPNARHAEAEEAPPPSLKTGEVAVWHPSDGDVPEAFESSYQDRQMERLRGIAGHLEWLNAELASARTIPEGQKETLLKKKDSFRPQTFFDDPGRFWKETRKNFRALGYRPPPMAPGAGPPAMDDDLERIAVTRRMVANCSYVWDDVVKGLLLRLLAISSIVAFGFQWYNYLIDGPAPVEGMIPWDQVAVFSSAFLLLLFGLLYYERKTGGGLFDRQNDYRAIAEGLRVQFYWSAAGTGLSVASSYLQRARGELSWIRAAVSAIAFPYEKARRVFDRLPHAEKHRRLLGIYEGWFSEQEEYFARRTYEYQRSRHRLKTTANLGLVAGFVLMLGVFFVRSFQDTPLLAELLRQLDVLSWRPLVFWLAGMAAAWLAATFVTYRALHAYYKKGRKNIWVKFSGLLMKFRHSFWLLLAGVTLGAVLFCAVFSGADAANLADPLRQGNLGYSALLAVGGLLHSWVLAKFLSENIRRYAALRDLFRVSSARMVLLLDEYRREIESQAAADGSEETTRRATEADMQASIVAMQELIIRLGSEALHENSDWLQMHRDKPVEPAIPAG